MTPAPRTPGSADLLGATLLFSLVLHGVLILGISFEIGKPKPQLPTLDVTLVNVANGETPDHADFLAQANNAGGGDSDVARRPSQPVSGLLPTAAAGLAPRPLDPAAPPPVDASGPRRVTTRAEVDPSVASDPEHPARPTPEVRNADTETTRHQEMARLAAEIRAESQAYAKRPHKKYISANTREYAYAAYMRAWAARVERVGTLNFPDAARQGQMQGNLILTVALNRDGGIKSVDVIESSGRKVLDDAAIRIVRLAAPFPPIPRTGEKVDELYITRTYQFLRSGTLQTH